VFDGVEREHDPLALVDHVHELVFEEGEVLIARLVGTSIHGSLDVLLGPWNGV
jgi:hypothetical protein